MYGYRSILSYSSTALVIGLVCWGCSTMPKQNMALDAARAGYYAAENNPKVAQNAPLELEKAHEVLTESERLLLKGADPEEVEHYAYLAKQRVAIAREAAALNQAEAVVKEADVTEVTHMQTLFDAETSEPEKLQEELAARETERGLTFTLGDVLFDTGSANLKPGALRTLLQLAAFLRDHPERRVSVEGFTDSQGSESYNLRLSQARADAVRVALIVEGVDPHRIDARGYGELYAMASNSTTAGRQLNRRVELVISDERGVIPPLSS